MASQFVIDINSNDDLSTVIRKCNANFKAIMSQYAKQRQIDNNDISTDIGDAVDDLVAAISHEADLRIAGDQALDNAIGVVDGKFTDYTPTSNLAAVATSGDYSDLTNKPTASDYLEYSHDDLLWKIENNTVGEVMKKTDITGYTDLVVRCAGEDGNPCYTPLVLIPKDSYQNYTANGKTFKMEINTSDNNRLWWVVPTGTWELWMR